jgi:hypothetical protein
MSTIPESAAFERGIDSVLQFVLPDRAAQVANPPTDKNLSERIEELATKNTEGELSPEERAEYAGYVRANKFVAVLQRWARKRLSTQS